MINLGSKVKDKISGFTGVAVAKTEWLHGCVRITVSADSLTGGKPVDNQCFDEPQLETIKLEKKKKTISRHGDRESTPRTGF